MVAARVWAQASALPWEVAELSLSAEVFLEAVLGAGVEIEVLAAAAQPVWVAQT